MDDDGIRMIKQKGGGEKNEHVYGEDKSNCLDEKLISIMNEMSFFPVSIYFDMTCNRFVLDRLLFAMNLPELSEDWSAYERDEARKE